MTKKRQRTSKAEWFSAALDVLERDGIGGVRIDVLAKLLGTSRSGFYWHFKDRGALLDELLDYWAHEFTEVIAENRELLAAEPRNAIEATAAMVFEHDLARYVLAFLAWARQDDAVAQRVRGVVDVRLDFLRRNFKALGFRGDDLEMRTRLFVCYQSWERATFVGESDRKLKKLMAPRMRLLMGPEESAK